MGNVFTLLEGNKVTSHVTVELSGDSCFVCLFEQVL